MSVSLHIDAYLTSEYAQLSSPIFRDLSANFKKGLEDNSLEPKERFLSLLSMAVTLENKNLAALAQTALKTLEVPQDLIEEAAQIAGIMGMNNVYYKFRSFLPAEIASDYQRTGLRVSSVSNTLNTKKDFELMALAVSIINGCPICVVSHEKSARATGHTPTKIHDVARLAATTKGLTSLKKALLFTK